MRGEHWSRDDLTDVVVVYRPIRASRRRLPPNLSPTGFMFGVRVAVLITRVPAPSATRSKVAPRFASRSSAIEDSEAVAVRASSFGVLAPTPGCRNYLFTRTRALGDPPTATAAGVMGARAPFASMLYCKTTLPAPDSPLVM
jgi:hypothetical protein